MDKDVFSRLLSLSFPDFLDRLFAPLVRSSRSNLDNPPLSCHILSPRLPAFCPLARP